VEEGIREDERGIESEERRKGERKKIVRRDEGGGERAQPQSPMRGQSISGA
jgi:hypothetical protein